MTHNLGDPIPLRRDASGRLAPAGVPGPTWLDRCAWHLAAAMLKRGKLTLSDRQIGAIATLSYDLAEALQIEADARQAG